MDGSHETNRPQALVPSDRQPQLPAVTSIALPPVVTVLGVIAILYVGKDVLMPLAVALLLTFAIAPLASLLRRAGLSKILAVILTVSLVFAAITAIALVVASQVSQLAQNIPQYQYNIIQKIQSLREMGAAGGIIDRISGAVERVGQELQASTQGAPAPAQAPRPDPLPVEIVAHETPLDLLRNIVVPLITPFATAGLVVVVVIFMLMEREGLRDRFIRLVGANDLHRTTEALQDAGRRVGQYLLMQLVVNITYAIPITIGLWLLGIPNALLWGMLTLVLRFVPYIGPVIGMVMPVILTLAVGPGWAPVLWTIGLFLAVELISNNVMEPWLYGSRTGLSPMAVIVAAIFWGWLWGPFGLVLSAPLTVCLVVLGKHVPHFEFLDVLFGNEPVLEPRARVYQRLLAGDPDEAADYAEEILRDEFIVDFYDKIGIPALLLGEQDRQRGVMSDETLLRFAGAARELVEELGEIAEEEEEEIESAEEKGEENSVPVDSTGAELPDGEGLALVCVGGRSPIDDAAAAMLAQALSVQGAETRVLQHDSLSIRQLRLLDLADVHAIILTFLNSSSVPYARHAVRRLKRQFRHVRVGVFVPGETVDGKAKAPFLAETINADFVAASIADSIVEGFARTRPLPVVQTLKGSALRRRRPVKA